MNEESPLMTVPLGKPLSKVVEELNQIHARD